MKTVSLRNLKEVREGLEDANEEIQAMLSCVPCYAEQWLNSCRPPRSDYSHGWAMAMLEAKQVPHTCEEPTE